jgi:tetratricopeptide (TPR) repeat protein
MINLPDTASRMPVSHSSAQWRTFILRCAPLVILFIMCLIAERFIIADIQSTYYLNRARELSPDPDHYEKFIDNALRANPLSGIAHFERSRVLTSQKRYQPALEESLNSLRSFSSVALYKHLASLYLKSNDTVLAREFFEKSARILPSDPDSVEALASIFIKQKRFHDARAILTRAVALHPKDANLPFWLGLTERALGNANDALAAFSLAVQNRTTSPRRPTFSLADAYFNQAHILAFSLHSLNSAIDFLQKAIDTEPKPEYYYLIIQIYDQIGQKQQAQSMRDKALKLFPDSQPLRDWKPSEK